MRIKSILVSQPKPENDKSPYNELAETYDVKIDFKKFIQIEGVPSTEIRRQRISLANFNCIILNSRNAADHYFRMAEELRYNVPETNKYFCTTEAIALYLQKYIVYRKRKIFFGQKGLESLEDQLKKNKKETFLFPCSDKHNDQVSKYLKKIRIKFKQVVFYKTVFEDMQNVNIAGYDLIIFFSPAGVESLMHNFPDFKQGDTKIAVFGPLTKTAVEKLGLNIDLVAPYPEAPSMTMALDKYLATTNPKASLKS